MKPSAIAIAILTLSMIAAWAVPVRAQTVPPLPHAFYGNVTINGAAAPAGTSVEARGTNVRTGVQGNPISTTQAGQYGSADPLGSKLVVQGTIPDGSTITFYVNNVSTGTTAQWHSGSVTQLNLSATTAAPVTPPSAATSAASSIGTTSATLSGTLSSKGTATTVNVSFEYGTAASYGGTTATQAMTQAGTFTATLTGLTPATLYYFRAKADGGAAGVAYGSQGTFSTAALVAVSGGGGGGVSLPTPSVSSNLFGSASSTSISSSGEISQAISATSADGRFTLTIPSGTFAKEKNGVALSSLAAEVSAGPPAPPAGAKVIGLAYNLGPSGATFSPPITLTFKYTPSDIPAGVAEADLTLAFYDEAAAKWVTLPSTVNAATGTVTAQVAHFTTFALMATAKPAALTATAPDISPKEVSPGQKVNISFAVSNSGGREGSYTATLLINGVKEQEQTVSVAAGARQIITFSVTKDKPGTYTMSLAGAQGSFTVVAPAAMAVANLAVRPGEARPGDAITISALVSNTGSRAGNFTVTLLIDNVKDQERSVTLAASSSETVTFTVTRSEPGTYRVDIEGQKASFTISGAPRPPAQPNWTLLGGLAALLIVVVALLLALAVRRKG